MNKKIILPVKGMHCNSCEMIIESTTKRFPHVQNVKASRSRGTVEIEFTDKEPNLQEIQDNIEKLGYHIGEQNKTSRLSKDPSEYGMFFVILLGVFIFYMIIKDSGISFDSIISNNAPSLPIVLLIGLTAGISSCMALVGGLILGISAKRNETHENQAPGKRILPQIYFNSGRIMGFAFLGGLLGTFGSFIKLSATSMSVLTIIVGVIMVLLGINLTHISPRMSKRSIGLPKFLSTGIHKHKNYTPKTSALITGAFTFFLPCGFTFAMQVYAISTGSFLQGALVMGVFALGTLPGLLSIGALASFVKGTFAKYFYRFVGVLVLVLGIYNISNAYNIVKVQFQNQGAPIITNNQLPITNNQITEETIHMTYSDNGLEPAMLNLQAGKKYTIIIDSQIDVGGCMSTILLPGLDNNTQLVKKGSTITFSFIAKKTGTFGFVCAMGLSHNAKVIIQ